MPCAAAPGLLEYARLEMLQDAWFCAELLKFHNSAGTPQDTFVRWDSSSGSL